MFGVVIPVGPGDRELTRLAAVTAELARHERASDVALFVVDDGPQAREIPALWPSQTVIRTEIRRTGRPDLFSAHTAGTLESLAAVRDAGLEFAVKLDTDAAVIAPFSAALRHAFGDATLGVVGSYDRTADGGVRDWSMWPRQLAAAQRPVAIRRAGRGIRVIRRSRAHRAFIAGQRRSARAIAPPGAHCLGGAYAVSGAFLATAALDWRPWMSSGLGEDVIVGLLCSAAGLRMQSLTGPGEPFGLAWSGLPFPPAELTARGHAIVHSVKAAGTAEERALRDELQQASRSEA